MCGRIKNLYFHTFTSDLSFRGGFEEQGTSCTASEGELCESGAGAVGSTSSGFEECTCTESRNESGTEEEGSTSRECVVDACSVLASSSRFWRRNRQILKTLNNYYALWKNTSEELLASFNSKQTTILILLEAVLCRTDSLKIHSDPPTYCIPLQFIWSSYTDIIWEKQYPHYLSRPYKFPYSPH